jgi:DNA-binding CsgD family transcriptional regulator
VPKCSSMAIHPGPSVDSTAHPELNIGIVEFTLDGPQLPTLLGGHVAWRINPGELNSGVVESPVQTVVFHIDLNDQNGLFECLEQFRRARPDVRTLLAGSSGDAILVAEVNSVEAGSTVLPLTNREQQVLRAIQSGYTNREIASLLQITLSTVNRHVESILFKLSARNRAEAASRSLTWIRKSTARVNLSGVRP